VKELAQHGANDPLHDVYKSKAHSVALVCPHVCWTDFDEILKDFYATGESANFIIRINFL
jgi:hypothetical protein